MSWFISDSACRNAAICASPGRSPGTARRPASTSPERATPVLRCDVDSSDDACPQPTARPVGADVIHDGAVLLLVSVSQACGLGYRRSARWAADCRLSLPRKGVPRPPNGPQERSRATQLPLPRSAVAMPTANSIYANACAHHFACATSSHSCP